MSKKSLNIKGKGGRIAAGPPGTPQGAHDVKNPNCRCGRCGNLKTRY